MKLEFTLGETIDYYSELKEWWSAWRFTAPSIDMLPKNVFVISYGGINICAGFLYQTGTSIHWMEYIVSNFEIKERELRRDAIMKLLMVISETSKRIGGSVIFSSLRNESLMNHMKAAGFMVGSSGCVEMIKKN